MGDGHGARLMGLRSRILRSPCAPYSLSVPIGNKPKKGAGIFGNGIAELRFFFIAFQYFVDFFVHRFQIITNLYLIGIIQQKLS